MTTETYFTYMIALDDSANSNAVWETGINMIPDKERDHLYIISVAETLRFSRFLPGKLNEEADKAVRETCQKVLQKYANLAKQRGFKHVMTMMAVGSHAGALICDAVKTKGADYLILGRREFGQLERVLFSSTSRYCIENADCNVLIVKGYYLPEEHGNLQEVLELEEKERERRINELADEEKKERESFISGRGSAREAEEEERARRLKEELHVLPIEEARAEREAGCAEARKAEEAERQRRLKEDAFKEHDPRREDVVQALKTGGALDSQKITAETFRLKEEAAQQKRAAA